MAQYELLIHARRAVVDGRIQQAAVTVDSDVEDVMVRVYES